MNKDSFLNGAIALVSFASGLGALVCAIGCFVRGDAGYSSMALGCLVVCVAAHVLSSERDRRRGIPSLDERIEALRKAQERDADEDA